MKYPSPQDFANFFKRIPKWVIVLIVVMLYIRFVIAGLWHLM